MEPEFTLAEVFLQPCHATEKNYNFPWLTLNRNQGKLGACAPYSVVENLNYVHEKILSHGYLFIVAKADEGSTTDDGCRLRNVMNIAETHGTVNEDCVKDHNLNQHMIGERKAGSIENNELSTYEVLNRGLIERNHYTGHYRFEGVHEVFNIDDAPELKVTKLKEALVLTRKVPVSMVFRMATDSNHVSTVYGYSDSQSCFKLKNCWEENRLVNYEYSKMDQAIAAMCGTGAVVETR